MQTKQTDLTGVPLSSPLRFDPIVVLVLEAAMVSVERLALAVAAVAVVVADSLGRS